MKRKGENSKGNFQEKPTKSRTPCRNSNEQWIHLKSCLQTTEEETIGIKESKNIKNLWITGKMLEKMEESGRI